MKVALAQINSLVGDTSFNEQKIKAYIKKASQKQVQLLVFPELALNAYPPLDLLRYPFFLKNTDKALQSIHKEVPKDMAVLVGAVGLGYFNACFLLQKNKKPKMFAKECLADYNVFDEKRYFNKGRLRDNFFLFQGNLIQILICEELWQGTKTLRPLRAGSKSKSRGSFSTGATVSEGEASVSEAGFENIGEAGFALKQKPNLIVSLNASPFDLFKMQSRLQATKRWVTECQCPLVYVNRVGGQEELIFDGASFVLDKRGQVIHQSSLFKEELSVLDISLISQGTAKVLPKEGRGVKGLPVDEKELKANKLCLSSNPKLGNLNIEKTAIALEFGLKEFVFKNGFTHVHIGLSGGVDSAVVACLACRALGAQKVRLFFLPGPFTSSLSKRGAYDLSKKLKCPLVEQSIKELYSCFLKQVHAGLFTSSALDVTKQNGQARLRSLFLMAYANQYSESLLLGTANKSELALGYGTLYGDLTGGLFPIGDLFKTEVFALAQYFKVPAFIRKRPPSAELALNQKDEDDLPPYKTLDPVLKKIVEDGADPQTAFEKQIFQKITQSQFKRKQSPPILKIKNRGFDRGWRWPFCSSHGEQGSRLG